MTAPPMADVAALEAIRETLERAENAGDADTIASHLSDDAVFMVPHVPPCEGKAASEALLREVLADLLSYYNRRIVYTSAEIRVDAQTAFDRGTFAVDIEKKDGSDPDRFSGKYLWTYTRDGGGWKLARAIVSLDQQDDEVSSAATGTEAKAPERLETARLVLRRPVVADVEAIFTRFASDPEVTRYVGWPRHPTLESTSGFIDFADAEWARGAAGPYLIESRETGRVLGCTGLSFETPYRASTGYVLATDAWGHGFATEALRAMVDVAHEHGVVRLYAIVHPGHQASMRVLEKCGFEREALLKRYTVFPNLSADPSDVVVYTRL